MYNQDIKYLSENYLIFHNSVGLSQNKEKHIYFKLIKNLLFFIIISFLFFVARHQQIDLLRLNKENKALVIIVQLKYMQKKNMKYITENHE